MAKTMRNWGDVLPPRVAMEQAAYDRGHAAARMREAGLTFREMGLRLGGVGPERARQIWWAGIKRLKKRAPIEAFFLGGRDEIGLASKWLKQS